MSCFKRPGGSLRVGTFFIGLTAISEVFKSLGEEGFDNFSSETGRIFTGEEDVEEPLAEGDGREAPA